MHSLSLHSLTDLSARGAGGAPDFGRQQGRPDPSADATRTLDGDRLALDVATALQKLRRRPMLVPDMRKDLGREAVGVGAAAPADQEGPLDWPNPDPAAVRPRAWGALSFGKGGAAAGHEGFFAEAPTGDIDAGAAAHVSRASLLTCLLVFQASPAFRPTPYSCARGVLCAEARPAAIAVSDGDL